MGTVPRRPNLRQPALHVAEWQRTYFRALREAELRRSLARVAVQLRQVTDRLDVLLAEFRRRRAAA